jgi:hypothetical protein
MSLYFWEDTTDFLMGVLAWLFDERFEDLLMK